MMRWSFSIGSFFGIPVRVHYALIAMLVFLVAIAPPAMGPVLMLMTALIIFGSVLAHELGHSLVARRYGIETKVIMLHPLGGAAVLNDRPPSPRAEMWIAFAGPLVSLALAGVGFLGFLATGLEFFEHLAWPNLLIGGFNLLPAFPLDGGRMLRAGLEMKFGQRRATKWAALLGRVLATGLFVTGMVLGQPMMAIVAVFIFLAGTAEERSSLIHGFMARRRILETMDGVDESLTAGGDVSDALRILGHNPKLTALPVTFGERVIGVVHRQLLMHAISRASTSTISELLDRNIVTQDGDGPLVPLLQKMGEAQSRAAVIVEGGTVRGIITLDRLVEAIKDAKD
jgi:Zn-dependent protease